MFEVDEAKGAQVIGHPGSLFFPSWSSFLSSISSALSIFFFARFHECIYCDSNLHSPKALGTILRFSDELIDVIQVEQLSLRGFFGFFL